MDDFDVVRAGLGDALSGAGTPLARADRLCRACVGLLGVDGAAITLLHDGASRGTFGASGPLGRQLDELQFTFGEGPCLEAVALGEPVLVPRLGGQGDKRWPAYTEAALRHGVGAVFAMPVTVASLRVGALDLFRMDSGRLTSAALQGAKLAARLAAVPLLDLMSGAEIEGHQAASGWDQLAGLERTEIDQATGMIVDRLGIGPVDALARIRAHAYANGMTASETAWAIVSRSLQLADDREHPRAPPG